METREDDYLHAYIESQNQIQELDGIQNLEYSPNGEIFSYCTESSLKIYSATSNMLRNIINVKIDAMKYFQNNTLLHSRENSLLYLSVYDNRHMRKFDGHSDRICEISVNTSHDTFMSIGTSKINIWDIRYQNPIFSIQGNGKLGALSEDHEFALTDNNFIYLFDDRNPKGPVLIKTVKPNFYKKIQYTGDGTCVWLSSYKTHVFLNTKGEHISTFSLENSCDPDVFSESNIFIGGSSQMIFAYKIPDKKIIGRTSVPNFELATVRTNPLHPQFVCATADRIKVLSIGATY